MFLPVTHRMPVPFHGEVYEDIDDWILQYERVAQHNQWAPEQGVQNNYFSLNVTACVWSENQKASLTSCKTCKEQIPHVVSSQQLRELVEELAQARIQRPNDSVFSFVEDVI